MDIAKLYYNGKCVMTVDMDCVEEDNMREYLDEILGIFQERAFKEFDIDAKFEAEVRKVWKGNEDLYEMKNQVEKEIESEGFEKIEQLFDVMKERLSAEKYELFGRLRGEDVKCYNRLETDFYAGTGCIDYVWVERNGKKHPSFLY